MEEVPATLSVHANSGARAVDVHGVYTEAEWHRIATVGETTDHECHVGFSGVLGHLAPTTRRLRVIDDFTGDVLLDCEWRGRGVVHGEEAGTRIVYENDSTDVEVCVHKAHLPHLFSDAEHAPRAVILPGYNSGLYRTGALSVNRATCDHE